MKQEIILYPILAISRTDIEKDIRNQLVDLYVRFFWLQQCGKFQEMEQTKKEALDFYNFKLSGENLPEIINIAKRKAIHYPGGLFLSDEALKRVFDQRSKYDFSTGWGEEYQLVTAHLRYDNSYVGKTEFVVNPLNASIDEVNQKIFSPGTCPGLGLLMLDYLQDYCLQEGVRGITLTTPKRPIGLGNLGFDYQDSYNMYDDFQYAWNNPEVRRP